MIGFGELRKLATQWQTDLAQVERAYASDWLLFGIYHQPALSQTLVLRGASALRHAYFADYPATESLDLLSLEPLDENHLRDLLAGALGMAQNASGIPLSLADLDRGGAKIEYTGPLGRRSAAQPRLTLAIVPGKTRLAPIRMPLLHLFSDTCAATVAAFALEENAAERIALLSQSPRARDVFDLWFLVTRASNRLDAAQTRALVEGIAQEKQIARRTDSLFAPEHRAILARAWDSALKSIRDHPPLDLVESDLKSALGLEFGI